MKLGISHMSLDLDLDNIIGKGVDQNLELTVGFCKQ